MSLRNFIVREELKTSHAERYLTYVDRYHGEVFHDLRKNLTSAWERAVSSASRDHPLHPESAQSAVLKNPKATVEISLSSKPEKVATSRSPSPIEVSPSVKVPLSYSSEERKLVTEKFLESARESIEKTMESWSEIFNYEKNGRLRPWFKVTSDHEEVRVQLSMREDDAESYRTLYAVRVEYGKKSSKLRDFDRIYLVNLVK